MAFNPSVQPAAYNGMYGGIPGQLTLPDSQYAQTNALVPNLPSLTGLASGVIGSELGGNLSTGTEDLLQNEAAGYGVSVGLPWSTGGNSVPFENFLQNTGITSEELSNTGFGNYINFLTGVGSQTLSPSLESSIQGQNAVTSSSPIPTLSAFGQEQQQQLGQTEAAAYQAMLSAGERSAAGGYGGGGGSSQDIFNPMSFDNLDSTSVNPLTAITGNPDYGSVLTGGNSLPTDSGSWDELLSDLTSPAGGASVASPAGGL